MGADLDLETIRQAPKALLHDHLDGGLRPASVIELAAEQGYTALPDHRRRRADGLVHSRGGRQLPREYLETFEHTVGVMQTRDAIERVAAECAEDLATDGVVYAEIRYAPEQHVEAGLTMDEVVEAVTRRVRRRQQGTGHHRAADPVGHAPAGPLHRDRRAGRPPPGPRRGRLRHRRRRRRASPRPATSTPSSTCSGRTSTSPSTPARPSGCRRSGRRIQFCGAERLGHGVRIVDDIEYDADGEAHLGPTGGLRARPPHPAGDVPDVERQTRARRLHRRAPDQGPARPALPRHGQHRQPADERHVDSGEFAGLPRPSAGAWPRCGGSP